MTSNINVRNSFKMMLTMCIMTLCTVVFFALPASAASREDALLSRINAERAKAGISALTSGSSELNAAAEARAKELTANYSYVRPNGKREFTILSDYNVSDITVGEDYLAGCDDPAAVVNSWMNNDYFRARILNEDAVNVGIGYYKGGTYGYYWVAIFTYPDNTSNSFFAQEVLDLVNGERAKYNLTPLVMGDAELNKAAQIRAQEISVNASHTRPNGTSCFTIWDECNSMSTATGENAAWGSVSPEEVVNDWMNSAGHRANILDPEAREMSVGYYYSSNSQYGHNWTQLFAK